MSKKPLIKKIEDELIRRGFRTEISALRHLKKEGFLVVPQFPFIDPTENKVRSIDIKSEYFGGFSFPKRKQVTLFIECKKSDKQKWVFYTEYSNFDLQRYSRDPTYDLKKNESIMAQLKRSGFSFFDLFKEPNRLGLSQINILKDDPDLFLDAQMKVLKSIWHYLKNTYSHFKYDPNYELIIPVIVFEGDMYEYYYKSDVYSSHGLVKKGVEEEMKIEKIDCISFVSNGFPEDPTPVLIDVVSIDYFSEYIQNVKEEYEKLPGR